MPSLRSNTRAVELNPPPSYHIHASIINTEIAFDRSQYIYFTISLRHLFPVLQINNNKYVKKKQHMMLGHESV